jgi:hypothetical protein
MSSETAIRTNRLWDTQPADWMCVCCRRRKSALWRAGKGGSLVGALHWHHDHLMDYPNALLRARLGSDWMPILEQKIPGADHFRSGLCRFVERFPAEIICQDCNVAEGAAKRHIQADRFFSFAPPEIARIITPSPSYNSSHRINKEVAVTIWKTETNFLARRKQFVERTIERLLAGDFWSAGYSFSAWHYQSRNSTVVP